MISNWGKIIYRIIIFKIVEYFITETLNSWSAQICDHIHMTEKKHPSHRSYMTFSAQMLLFFYGTALRFATSGKKAHQSLTDMNDKLAFVFP